MKELRLVLLGLAAAIALLLSGGFLVRAFRQTPRPGIATAVVDTQPKASPATQASTSPAPSPARAALEREIADAPDYARFFDRLRRFFPDDYGTILDTVAANAKEKTLNVDLVMADAVSALRRVHGALAMKASDPALDQIFAWQLREMQALAQRDPHLCVAFLYGANGVGFLSFAADHRGLVADAAIAGLDAMNSGRSEQVERSAPSDSDFQALDRMLVAKKLTRPEIDALLDGKLADPPIADAAMCEAGQTYLATLATLPSDMRGRLYGLAVDLMAKS